MPHTVRRDDKKKTNAKINTKRFENVGIVHKIGKKTDVTTGIVLSPEHYDELINETSKEYLFLVKGTNGKFSDEGSLVFCRPRSVQETHVDILGIVYANNLTVNDHDDDDGVDDDDDHDDENDEQTKCFPNEGAIKRR